MTDKRIADAKWRVREAEVALEAAEAAYDEAIAADPGVEELARRIWLHLIPYEDDREGFNLQEDLARDLAERDRCWRTLLIDEERNDYRRLAVELIGIAKDMP